MNSENHGTRLNKFLSQSGYCSRRKADALMDQGRITVNGVKALKGTKVSSSDDIRVDGERITGKTDDFTYLAFNKPVGIVCTTDTRVEKNNIIDFINYHKRIFPVGRLDKLSEGLILMTDDGDIVNKILRASNRHEKEYIVTVDKPITPNFVSRMEKGVPILGQMTKKCKVNKVDAHTFQIILKQGLNRQIRRMCEYLGYQVTSLKRIRIMHIVLDIPVGTYRPLSANEMQRLKRQLVASTNQPKQQSKN